MASGVYLLVFLTLQRFAELALARRNTRRLVARGARERGRAHYPLMVGFHTCWLAAMWLAGFDAALEPIWTGLFIALQPARFWIIWTLGDRWTTRIIVLDEPLVRAGPYRRLRHPNYAVVVAEMAIVPLALGAPALAVGFSILHVGVLAVRLRAENAALRQPAPAGR